MLNFNLSGVFPALITPYRADESFDPDGLRRLVRHLAPDVDGFLVNGTTADFPLLTREERRAAIALVVEEASGKPVLAGTGGIATHEVIAFTRDAAEAGASGALIIAPYYLRPSAAGMLRHYADVAAAAPELPILLYNFPQLVGQPIPVAVIQELQATCPNIIGMKDTSGDIAYLLEVVEKLPADFQVLAGRGTVFLPALAAGAVGAILACANLIPALWRQVYRDFCAGDLAAARAGQYRGQRVTRFVGKGGSLAVREGLRMQGLDFGPPRRPLTLDGVLTAAELEAFRQALAEAQESA